MWQMWEGIRANFIFLPQLCSRWGILRRWHCPHLNIISSYLSLDRKPQIYPIVQQPKNGFLSVLSCKTDMVCWLNKKKSECVFKLLTLHITLSHGGCNEWKWTVQFNSLWPSGIRIALQSICLVPPASWCEGATHLYFILWTTQVVKINKREGYRINGKCRSCSQRCEEENRIGANKHQPSIGCSEARNNLVGYRELEGKSGYENACIFSAI